MLSAWVKNLPWGGGGKLRHVARARSAYLARTTGAHHMHARHATGAMSHQFACRTKLQWSFFCRKVNFF